MTTSASGLWKKRVFAGGSPPSGWNQTPQHRDKFVREETEETRSTPPQDSTEKISQARGTVHGRAQDVAKQGSHAAQDPKPSTLVPARRKCLRTRTKAPPTPSHRGPGKGPFVCGLYRPRELTQSATTIGIGWAKPAAGVEASDGSDQPRRDTTGLGDTSVVKGEETSTQGADTTDVYVSCQRHDSLSVRWLKAIRLTAQGGNEPVYAYTRDEARTSRLGRTRGGTLQRADYFTDNTRWKIDENRRTSDHKSHGTVELSGSLRKLEID